MHRSTHRLAAIAFVTLATLTAAPATAQPAPPTATPPQVISRVDAEYPPAELGARKEGVVLLRVTVGTDGTVAGAVVLESPGPPPVTRPPESDFETAAVAAVGKWIFKPAMRGTVPIESHIVVPFKFTLPPQGPAPVAPPQPRAPASVPAPAPAARSAQSEASPYDTEPAEPQALNATVHGHVLPPKGETSDYRYDVAGQAYVPRPPDAAHLMKAAAPGILLTNAGGEGHADQIFMRGFDAREGQDIEFSANGVPFNEVGNPHGNGYADTHFIIPELVKSVRIVEGPFDPRQGNFAVAGSADYELGLHQRGVTMKLGAGSFSTIRSLLLWGPAGASDGTYVGVELYETAGFGQNRDGKRGTIMAQYEGTSSDLTYRVGFNANLASFHTAGVLREDDYQKGLVGFYDTLDPAQGEATSRYALSGEIDAPVGDLRLQNLVYAVARPLDIRENFTGFLLDTQAPVQEPHGQRGDLIDLEAMEWTIGGRGAGKLKGELFGQRQELELGYFARGDFVSSSERRIEAATGHPYHVDSDLTSRLGDIGLYADATFRPWSMLAFHGGVRADLLTYDVQNNCAVQSVSHPSTTNPPDDQSCLSQQDFGRYREPTQRVSTTGLALLPRASAELGPFAGVTVSVAYGRGVRSIDPSYVIQDADTPFAKADSVETGLSYALGLDDVDLTASSAVFWTFVDKDLIFSETAGRNILGGGTTRAGDATIVRATGTFFDLSANVTYVRATFSDTGLLIPYIPDLVVRFDGAIFGDIPIEELRLMDHLFRASLGTGVTYVAPRPLPQGERSDTIATLDARTSVGWWLFDLGLSITNLLNTQYALGEYNYLSDFHTESNPTLVPVRHFSAGAPRAFMVDLSVNIGGTP